jgi:raffinose/stachyose/melibiose transport system substrate-binding protein
VFYQNGTWAYQDCISEGLTDEDLTMIPIYMGVDGEENQGLCTGSENYWCVNRLAAPEDIEATIAFTEWLIGTPEGQIAMSQELGFVSPFRTFTDSIPQNALQAAAQAMLNSGKVPVAWAFTTIPSETWKNHTGAAMLEYAQGTAGWDAVERAFVDGWAAESSAAQ